MPVQGTTSGYWSSVGDTGHPDLAWAYDFPTRQLLPIAGLVAFYNERVDITLRGSRCPATATSSMTQVAGLHNMEPAGAARRG